ncbi:MAG TPA: hypothetical protein VEU07_06045 [Candidatus Acidoferrum sp.]|nr:hypothetical protein [Candidatus Acidoferrum sp.]
MDEGRPRYEATLAPDGRILGLIEWAPDGLPRTIPPNGSAGMAILRAGHNILYRIDEERRLRNLPYLEVLEAMQQEVHLTLHKIRHGELLDEPEVAPILRRLLADIRATETSFRQAYEGRQAAP